MALALFSPVTTTDLWTNLRIGSDLFDGKGLPSVERYSATAAGRPFVAYEWGSAVVFTSIVRGFDGPGLTVLRILLGLTCLGLIHLALPRKQRLRGVTLVLLALSAYLLCFRALVRPHLFSLVFMSALVFALERWRRSGRLRDIVWLVPLHALWMNLHGAALFGIAVLGFSSIVVAFESRLGDRATAPREVASSLRGALQLAAVAVASLIACLANPYGIAVIELALRVSESSAYIKEAIWEWQSPLVTGPGKPWFPPYVLFLAALWVGVLARIRKRPWLDTALALLVTVQSLRANRFVPYVALVGFPIAVRGWLALTSVRFDAWDARKRIAAASAFIAFMLATSFGPASILSPRARRPVGWGYGGGMPYREVNAIGEAGYRGVIYNEYADGALIIHSLHPAVRPVMDARIDVYGEELYREYQLSRSSLAAFDDYIQKYAVDLVMLHRRAANGPFIEALQRDPAWRRVYETNRRVLFSNSRRRGVPREGA